MRCVRLLNALVLALLASGGALLATSEVAVRQAACRRVPLATHPKSMSSAVYVPALHKILVVDPVVNRLLLFGEDGAASALADPVVAAEAKLPALLAPTPQGFMLKTVSSKVLYFDANLHLQGEPKSLAAGNEEATVGAITQWTVADGSIVAYGAVRSTSFPKGSDVGFLRTPLAGQGQAELLLPFAQSSYYLLGYQYLATIGQTAYFLRMGDEAVLFAVPPGGKPVVKPGAVPPAFRSVPKLLTPFNGPADGPAHYAEVERLTIPAGLYGGPDGFLYLLTRQPGKKVGETDWWLYRLNREDGKVLGQAQLPTKAKHLSVVPSPAAWFFFEKGEVDSIERQSIESMMAVPSSRLTRATASGAEVCPELAP